MLGVRACASKGSSSPNPAETIARPITVCVDPAPPRNNRASAPAMPAESGMLDTGLNSARREGRSPVDSGSVEWAEFQPRPYCHAADGGRWFRAQLMIEPDGVPHTCAATRLPYDQPGAPPPSNALPACQRLPSDLTGGRSVVTLSNSRTLRSRRVSFAAMPTVQPSEGC